MSERSESPSNRRPVARVTLPEVVRKTAPREVEGCGWWQRAMWHAFDPATASLPAIPSHELVRCNLGGGAGECVVGEAAMGMHTEWSTIIGISPLEWECRG